MFGVAFSVPNGSQGLEAFETSVMRQLQPPPSQRERSEKDTF